MSNSSLYADLPRKSLGNRYLHLEVFATAGPRIVHFSRPGGKNMLAELPDMQIPTPYGDFHFFGGHRLWHSPEAMPRTYIPDNDGLELEDLADGLALIRPAELGTGISKRVEIHIAPDAPRLTLRHEMKNCGYWAVELAPWALTMFRLGGVAFFPQPVGNVDAAGLLPNRSVVMWPYASLTDPRMISREDVIYIDARRKDPPFKLGYLNPHGWMGYWLDGDLFIKRFETVAGANYPDYGCNTETYLNQRFLELETLGPLTRLQPGESVTHTETWELYSGLDAGVLPESIRKALENL